MVIRIRWRGVEPGRAGLAVALALGSLFPPLALIAFSMFFWAFAAQLGWTGTFVFKENLLAHWQVWLSLAGLLLMFGQLCSRRWAAHREDASRRELDPGGLNPESFNKPRI